MKFQDIKFEPKFPKADCEAVKKVSTDTYDWMSTSKQALITFPNGYGASILCGSMFYSNGVNTYELAIIHNDSLCYTTWITNDVMGYLSQTEIEQVLYEIERLCDAQKRCYYCCAVTQRVRRFWRYQLAPFLYRVILHKVPGLPSWFNPDL